MDNIMLQFMMKSCKLSKLIIFLKFNQWPREEYNKISKMNREK